MVPKREMGPQGSPFALLPSIQGGGRGPHKRIFDRSKVDQISVREGRKSEILSLMAFDAGRSIDRDHNRVDSLSQKFARVFPNR